MHLPADIIAPLVVVNTQPTVDVRVGNPSSTCSWWKTQHKMVKLAWQIAKWSCSRVHNSSSNSGVTSTADVVRNVDSGHTIRYSVCVGWVDLKLVIGAGFILWFKIDSIATCTTNFTLGRCGRCIQCDYSHSKYFLSSSSDSQFTSSLRIFSILNILKIGKDQGSLFIIKVGTFLHQSALATCDHTVMEFIQKLILNLISVWTWDVDKLIRGRIIAVNLLNFGSVFQQNLCDREHTRFCLKATAAASILVSLSQASLLVRFTARRFLFMALWKERIVRL